MNTQDIIKSLSNLEHSLQGVESARQQVEKTVAAYGTTQKQLAILSQEFVKTSNELNSVIDVVRNNQEQLSATLSSEVERLFVHVIVLCQSPVALYLQLVYFKLRAGLPQVSLRLLDRRLIGAFVDYGQNLALFNAVALPEPDFDNLPGNLRNNVNAAL